MPKGIVKKFRPDNWDQNVASLVKKCIEYGEVEIDETNRPQVEGFIRYCIEVGAVELLEGLRAYGVDAIGDRKAIKIQLSPVAIPGRAQYLALPLSYKSKAGYAGPGKVVFIPADEEIR